MRKKHVFTVLATNILVPGSRGIVRNNIHAHNITLLCPNWAPHAHRIRNRTLLRRPVGIYAAISALEKISSRVNSPYARAATVGSTSASTASLWIVNPIRGHTLMELFSTHPSTKNRINRLRRVAEEMGVYVH